MPDQSGRPDPGPAGLGDPVQPVEQVQPVEPVNGFRILDLVASLPISTWRYHWETPKVRHLGPMAQDWAATFGLGGDDTRIALVDANGVALVSIQALYRLVDDLRQELADLHERVAPLLVSDEERSAADDSTADDTT
ncbi:hypothetical protein SAMN05660350_04957 [Geodermatophilus obscurus]|uniref:Peptidase S74 domain-containing protein n=1 Tax=Geodermatophilus obscurus TaxID=1861 RepID=A0A1M7V1A6_9ACTN|nr:tail fiber domain-containing protein [Geodermatophilus obscurus]SHN88965.1 hypothetical protein SAMN05660350_04957 [Geodermatophilus obscurus]